MFVPLGVKTDYSLHKSLIKIDELISFALKNNLTHLGILDDNLNASHTFIKKCLENKIKPIIGLDLSIKDNNLYLYPKNNEGLISLFKLNKYLFENEIDLKTLKSYLNDVLVVLPYESIKLFKYFNDAYLSYKNEAEKKECQVYTDNLIFINPTYALDKESSKFVNYLKLHEANKKIGSEEFINYEQNVLMLFDYDCTQFIKNINIKEFENKTYIPKYDTSIDSKEYLNNLALKGIKRRLNGNVNDEYLNRLKYELNIINDLGFTDYFLIVFDYVRYARKNNIYVGVGRGSAVGSLVAYSLGITWIDPLKYDLLFERFLNPMRVTMPDIDIDFEQEKRELVFEYVKEKYGANNVAKIITYGTLRAKEALRVVARINDVPEAMISHLTKNIDADKTLSKNEEYEKIKEILQNNYVLKKVYNEAKYLEGLKSHISIHAAGVVISSENLTDIVPIVKNNDEFIVGYEKDELENIGLLKMDFLSLKTLTLITNVINDIKTDLNIEIDINNVSLDDESVIKMFKEVDTLGIFQLESIGIKNFLNELKIDNFNELVDAIALYRPGPMGSIDKYLEAKKTKKINYLDTSLESILKPTKGIIIYQEQIMQILNEVASYSYQEADVVRKGISKKNFDIIEKERKKFYERSRLDFNKTKEIFDLIVKFAEFGFNKSHSVAYSYVAFQMMYLKCYYPIYFYLNLLNSEIGNVKKTNAIINEAKMHGIEFIKPDINISKEKYFVYDNKISIPFKTIKGFGNNISEIIIKNRSSSYEDIYAFFKNINERSLSKKNITSLIEAGVFDSFKINRNMLIKNLDTLYTYSDLVNSLDESLVSKPLLKEYDEYSDEYLMEKELELFGFLISHHPSNKYFDCMKLNDITNHFNKNVDIYVLVERIKKIKDKNGKDMAFLDVNDEMGSGSVTIFADKINLIDDVVKNTFVHIKGRVERRMNKYSIILSDLKIINNE